MPVAEILINDEAQYIVFTNSEDMVGKCFNAISDEQEKNGEITEPIIVSVMKNGKYSGERYIWNIVYAHYWIKGRITAYELLDILKRKELEPCQK